MQKMSSIHGGLVVHVSLVELTRWFFDELAFYGNARKSVIGDDSHATLVVHLCSATHSRLTDSLAAFIISPLVHGTALIIVDCIVVEASICDSTSHTVLLYLGQLQRLVPVSVLPLASSRHVEATSLVSCHEDVAFHLAVSRTGPGPNRVGHGASVPNWSVRLEEAGLVLSAPLSSDSCINASLVASLGGLAAFPLVHETRVQLLCVRSSSGQHQFVAALTGLD